MRPGAAPGPGTGGSRQAWDSETLPQKEPTKQIRPIKPLPIPMAVRAFHDCGPSPTSRRVPGLHFRLSASNRQIPNADSTAYIQHLSTSYHVTPSPTVGLELGDPSTPGKCSTLEPHPRRPHSFPTALQMTVSTSLGSST